jgi:hypothetical protein
MKYIKNKILRPPSFKHQHLAPDLPRSYILQTPASFLQITSTPMASQTTGRREQHESNDTNTTQRSAWSTTLERLEKEYHVRGMNEVKSNAEYTQAGATFESNALSALVALSQTTLNFQPDTWRVATSTK